MSFRDRLNELMLRIGLTDGETGENLDSAPESHVVPHWDLDRRTLSEIHTLASAPEQIEGITDIEDMKKILNAQYKAAEKVLVETLKERNFAGWIIEAYRQLQLWTFVLRGLVPELSGKGPAVLAPAGRYGWRYVIEYCLGNVGREGVIFLGRPDVRHLCKAFTCLAVMFSSSEFSNMLHFIGDRLTGTRMTRMNKEFPMLVLDFPAAAQDMVNSIHAYIGGPRSEHIVKDADVDLFGDGAEGLRTRLDERLSKTNLGFTLGDIKKVFWTFCEHVMQGDPVIVVHSLDYLVDWISDLCDLSVDKVRRVMRFALLSADDLAQQPRDFLRRSQHERMLNHAGVLVPRLVHPELIYDHSTVESRPNITTIDSHVIISIPMFAEWMDVLSYRLLHGQRPDLKQDADVRRALELFENEFHTDVFERAVYERLRKAGFKVRKGITKYELNEQWLDLPCGELDALMIHPQDGQVVVVECKAMAGALDYRAFGQQLADHFKQKKYDEKFRRKVDWVRGNGRLLSNLNGEGDVLPVEPRAIRNILGVFVTESPSIIRFFVSDYQVLTLGELERELANPLEFLAKLRPPK